MVAQAEESQVPSPLIGFEKASAHESSPAANRFALGITLKLSATTVEDSRVSRLGDLGHWGLGYYARFLERPLNPSFRIPFFHRRGQTSSGALMLGKLGAGYGQVFTEDSVLARNRNGTLLEEPSFLFLKATFRF